MMKETLTAMLKPFGPSGNEGPIGEAIAGIIRPYVDEIRYDALGNLIATKHGPGKRVMFSAHMDSIGFIVLDANKEGYLYVSNVGGINVSLASGRAVVFANGVQGVVGSEPLGDGKPSMNKLFIDVGAETREEALEKVPVGTMAVVTYQLTDMGDRLCAPFMDDRAACAVLAELLMALKSPKHEVVAVFSTQEEVGCRGAMAAVYGIEPDVGVAIDVTPTGDTPKFDPPLPVKIGKGPAIKVKDGYSISTPSVRDGLVQAAKSAGIAYQYEVLTYGGTDAGAMMVSRGGVPSGTLSIPCRYVHSPVEMISLRDMEECVQVLRAYVQDVL